MWLPTFRLQSVTATGPGADIAKHVVQSSTVGTYFHIVPRNSIFFYPQRSIREGIREAVPEAAAVSLSRDSFNSIVVGIIPREESFLWCGADKEAVLDAGCYEADVEGYLFRAASSSPSLGSSTPAKGALMGHGQVRVYAPLDASDGRIIGSRVASAARLPNALKFVDAVRTLGAPVEALSVDGDEADLWVNGQTRIIYVLGQEKQAADLAASALPTLTLTDGSIQYVDLRFQGRAYIKRYGEP